MQGVLDFDQAEIIPSKTSLGNARLGKMHSTMPKHCTNSILDPKNREWSFFCNTRKARY